MLRYRLFYFRVLGRIPLMIIVFLIVLGLIPRIMILLLIRLLLLGLLLLLLLLLLLILEPRGPCLTRRWSAGQP